LEALIQAGERLARRFFSSHPGIAPLNFLSQKHPSSASRRLSFLAFAALCAGSALAQTVDPDSGSAAGPLSAAEPEAIPEAAAPDSVAPPSAPPPGPKAVDMNATVVRASRASAVKRQAYNVNAIDVAKLKEKNVTVHEVLNQSSGVVVRQEGGMGSGVSISLNGMSGNQVRTFLDGLPMDNFGPAMSMGNIPANTLENVEVYKGVVPIHLGADALGGAINIVTSSRFTPFVDGSYAYSSFNTHRAQATAQYVPDSSNTLVKAGAFYNSSDNDYEVTVRPVGSNGQYGDPIRVPRFHDAYKAYSGSVEAGVFRRGWADYATLGYAYGFEHDDIQHAVSMDRVYGRVFSEELNHTLSAKYRKRDFLTEGLSATAYASYTYRDMKVVDTAARIYDWYGDYTPNPVTSKGESQWEKIFWISKNHNFASNANLTYALFEADEVSVNWALNRLASRDYDAENEFQYRQPKPSVIFNQVYAASYKKSLFDGRASSTVFGKAYRTQPTYRTYEYYEQKELVDKADRFFPGYGLAATWFPTRDLQAKFSYENAVRMPESGELFGDGVLQNASIGLDPERSQNFNLGSIFARLYGETRLSAEGNLFFRDIKNLIYYEVVGPSSTARNLGKSQITGIDGEVGADWRGILEARLNATYDHAINTTEFQDGRESDVYLDRIPNRPYLYGNGYLAGHWARPGGVPGKLSLSMDTRYVRSYFLYWESQGETKFTIPSQLSHNLSLVYAAPRDRYSVALECDNVGDERLYDNFRQQKPGRTLSGKIRFSL
jgi:outer membrane receptor protein involved in Fe transport